MCIKIQRQCGGSPVAWIVGIAIGLAAVVALAVFLWNGHRQNRLAAGCLANLKRIGECFQMYAEDFGGALPYEEAQLRAGTRVTPWNDALRPYLLEREADSVLICPATAGLGAEAVESYRFNSQLETENRADLIWRKLSTIPKPEVTALVFDGDVGGSNVSTKGNMKDMCFRHREKCNVLFADFHVQPCVRPDKNWIVFEDEYSAAARPE